MGAAQINYASQHIKYAGNTRYLVIVAAIATAAAFLSVLVFLRFDNLVQDMGDPYSYGKIARGFVEHGFTKLTRRAASLYPGMASGLEELLWPDAITPVNFFNCPAR